MNAGCSPPRQGRTCTTRRKVHFPITDSRARRQLLRLIARGMKIRDAEVRLEARANGDVIQAAAAGEREVPEVAGVPEARGGIGTCSIDVVGDRTTLNGIASPARIGPSCVRILDGD